MRRLAILFVGLAVAFAVVCTIAVATFDWNRARPWLEQAASGALDRAVTIGGEIELQLSLVPTLRARDVRVSRSREKTASVLAEFDRFELQFPLLPLVFQRRFELLDVSASDGRLVIAGGSPGAEAAGVPAALGWLESLPTTLQIANLRIELGAERGKRGDLLIERASGGRCGDRLELEARWQDVPLALAARLVCPGKARVGLSGFEAKLGGSAVAGRLELDLGGERPSLSGEITSGDLRLEELARLVPTGGRDTRPFLDAKLPVASLAPLDVDLKLARTGIRLPWKGFGAVGNLVGRIRLEAGRLDLQVGKATIWEGALTAQLQAEGSPAEQRVALHASLKGASIAHLFPDGRANGRLDGTVELAGHGTTLRALLAGADGKASVIHGQVEFSSPPVGLLGRDVFGILFSQKSSGRLNCAVARTSLRDGLGPLAIVIDTPDTTVAGVGPLDLRDLRLNVVLRPRPHRASLGAIKMPVLVSGPITGPRAQLARGALLKGLGETALFSALNPFLLAAPLVDLGTGGGNPCERALEAATVQALKHKGELEKSVGAVGKGGHWLKRFLDRELRPPN